MNILIFAGTTEGRSLAQYLAHQSIFCHVCVATEYGEQLIEESTFIKIHAGRLTSGEMKELMKQEAIDLVIDATHPYAVIEMCIRDREKQCLEVLRLPALPSTAAIR